LPELLSYKRADLPSDIVAGLSVAAVALPVGVAYAQLAGFSPETGLYASILPLVAYALFGTSRQLIVGPDAATCALVAAAVGPLAAGNKDVYASLSMTLAFLAGVFCIAASFLKLGALADFLSRPILVGFLNGMALSIALGQIGKIFGFAITKEGIVPRLIEFASKLGLTHMPTLAIGLAAFVVLAVSPRLIPRLPAALAAMIVTGAAVRLFGLDAAGVKIVGVVPAGLPPLRIPFFPPEFLPSLFAQAAGVALIGFSSMMLTARSFAAKNRYEIDVDKEFAALGAANIASALSQGFAISGADSRTAMSDSAGGRTRVTGIVTAITVAAVLLFFTGPLQYVPVAALGAVLVKAAFSLLDLRALKTFYQIDRRELALSLLATLGVATVGAVQAILVAVILALLRFVRLVSRPKVEILGSVQGLPGLHSTDRHQNASTVSGLLMFRFNAPIVFFNAPLFKRSVLEAADAAGPALKWFVIDMIPVTMIDITGLQAAAEVIATLQARGVAFIAAGRQTEWRQWTESRRLKMEFRSFPTLRAALKGYEQENRS
jgi:high affinity sulfate transporter 1